MYTRVLLISDLAYLSVGGTEGLQGGSMIRLSETTGALKGRRDCLLSFTQLLRCSRRSECGKDTPGIRFQKHALRFLSFVFAADVLKKLSLRVTHPLVHSGE